MRVSSAHRKRGTGKVCGRVRVGWSLTHNSHPHSHRRWSLKSWLRILRLLRTPNLEVPWSLSDHPASHTVTGTLPDSEFSLACTRIRQHIMILPLVRAIPLYGQLSRCENSFVQLLLNSHQDLPSRTRGCPVGPHVYKNRLLAIASCAPPCGHPEIAKSRTQLRQTPCSTLAHTAVTLSYLLPVPAPRTAGPRVCVVC